ncbi:MAG: pseudouridine synthase [Candidatus Izemoplasmatales bacterium]|jgi:16S rRNA pseudouridine516 synthase|nr:pseudouridine synthase [Candidatus Izemoplasmatales bacterium]
MRIDKFLANLKYGTRSEIKEMISEKKVMKTGVIITDPATIINPEDDVISVDNHIVFYEKTIYIMMNKPKGVVCANKDARYQTVIDLVKEPYSRFDLDICGRLDIDTEGLLILTNDGNMLHQIISPKKSISKVYEVTLAKPLFEYSKLEKGIKIKDGKDQLYITKPATITKLTDTVCQIAITEGKFHQVKRMFEAIGNQVINLKRVAIGGLKIEPSLVSGEYKKLSFADIQAVFQ